MESAVGILSKTTFSALSPRVNRSEKYDLSKIYSRFKSRGECRLDYVLREYDTRCRFHEVVVS